MDQSRHVLKRALAMLLVFALVFSYGFNANTITAEAASAKYVTKVTVAKKKLTVQAKKSATVKVTIKGSKGVSKAYTVKSNKPAIASVKKTSKGVKITGKKAGKATIVITTKAKTKKKKQLKAKIAVTVKAAAKKTTQATTQATTAAPTVAPTQAPTVAPTKAPESLKITVTADPTTITEKGGQSKITVASNPAGTALASVEYESSNEQFATVKNGVVTGVNPGKAIITVTAKDANGNVAKGTVEITVKEANAINATISYNSGEDKATIVAGQTTKVSPIVKADTADYELEWTTSDPKVATVTPDGKSGVITAVGAGSAVITATVKGTTASASFTVTVDATAPSIQSFEATHADVLKVTFTSAFKPENTEKVNVSLKYGNKDYATTPVWAEDGKSVELKLKSEYGEGTYTVNISADEVALGSKTEATCEVAKREVKNINIKTNNIPFYAASKIYYDVTDQYGDVMDNVTPDDFVWRITPSNTAVNASRAVVDSSNQGYIVVKANYDKLQPGTDKYAVYATYGENGEVTAEKTVSIDHLVVQHIEITGMKAAAIYQDTEEQYIELTYTAKDQFGNDVDMQTYYNDYYGNTPEQERAYTTEINSWTENADLVSAPYPTKEGNLIIAVRANKNGEAVVRVDGADGKQSKCTVKVLREKLPKAITFPKESDYHVVAGEYVDIPVSFIDQYDNVLDKGSVSASKFTDYFTVSARGIEGIKNSDVVLINGADEDYIRVYANVEETGTLSLSFISRIAGIDEVTSKFNLKVTQTRNANKLDITEQPLDTIMVGQTTRIKFRVLDTEGDVWINKNTYSIKVDVPTNTDLDIYGPYVNDKGEGYVDVKGANPSTAAKTLKLKLMDPAQNKSISTNVESFTFNVERNADKIDAVIADKTVKAGKPVQIKFTAKYGQSNTVLTTYDETIKDVRIYDDNTDSFTLIKELKFENGVAEATVIADKVAENVTYSGEIVSPDNKQIGFKTNAIKIEASDAVKLDVTYNTGSNFVIKYLDVQGNIVKDVDAATTLNIKILDKDGNDVTRSYLSNSMRLDQNNEYVLTGSEAFNEGVATIASKNTMPTDATVTITDGKLSNEGKIKRVAAAN